MTEAIEQGDQPDVEFPAKVGQLPDILLCEIVSRFPEFRVGFIRELVIHLDDDGIDPHGREFFLDHALEKGHFLVPGREQV